MSQISLTSHLMASLVTLLKLLEHHWHLHLLHHHLHRVELHHRLTLLRMLVRAVHPIACVSKLANGLGVDEHAFVAVGALREKFTLFTRVVESTLALRLITVWVVNTPNFRLLHRCLPLRTFLITIGLLILLVFT